MNRMQVELSCEDTGATLVCWLDYDTRLKEPGIRLTLKEFPDIIWTLKNVYRGIQVDPATLLHYSSRTWKVGGLR